MPNIVSDTTMIGLSRLATTVTGVGQSIHILTFWGRLIKFFLLTIVKIEILHPASIMAILDMLVAASSKLLFCVTVHLALILQTQLVSM